MRPVPAIRLRRFGAKHQERQQRHTRISYVRFRSPEAGIVRLSRSEDRALRREPAARKVHTEIDLAIDGRKREDMALASLYCQQRGTSAHVPSHFPQPRRPDPAPGRRAGT
jgi:hypothetical protein